MRACVARARDCNPEIVALDCRLGGRVREAVHLPDIVHASFARFIQADQDSTAISARFRKLSEGFVPFTVRVTRLTMANERTPYMHQGREEGTAREFELY